MLSVVCSHSVAEAWALIQDNLTSTRLTVSVLSCVSVAFLHWRNQVMSSAADHSHPLGLSVHHAHTWVSSQIEAQGFGGPLSMGLYANAGCCHHVQGPCLGGPLQPPVWVRGQVSAVKAAGYVQSLAQFGGPVAKLFVLERSRSFLPSGHSQLPHEGHALKGFQRA